MMSKFLTKRNIIIGSVVVVLFGGAYLIFGGEGEAQETVAVERGDVMQTVAVTGTVKPSAVVDLAFLKTGRVHGIYADAGSTVVAGQIIAALEAGEEAANLASAKARESAAQAKLDELERGSRPEALAVARAEYDSAINAASEAETALDNAKRDAYTKADDAVRFKVDKFIESPRSPEPKLLFDTLSTQTSYEAEWGRSVIEQRLMQWETARDTITTEGVRANLDAVRSYLDIVAKALGEALVTGSVTSTNIETWKGDVATARTSVATALTNLSAADEKISTTRSALALEKRQLELTEAGTDPTVVAAQRAAVQEAAASVRNYEAQIAKTVIRTPIAGVVSKMDLRLGEIVDAGRVVSGVLSKAAYEIEANIPEADISKVAVGQKASVTLDAYGSDVVFEAKVVAIDPGETIIEGIPTYKTKLQFVDKDERIRSGMTANVEIHGEEKADVVVVPSRAVVREDGKAIVRVATGEGDEQTIEEREVTLGLRGTNGFTEILSGLEAGDKIIVFLRPSE